jgi:hypothetical protein
MKILVEIDLPDVEPDDIYKPNSDWFNEPGYINIPLKYLNDMDTISDLTKEEIIFRYKYIGQVQAEIPRP